MSLHEDDLPVLNAVVESGNHSIIQSTRLGNEVLRELESLRQDSIRGVPANDNQDTAESLLKPERTSESDTLTPNTADLANTPAVEFPQDMDFASLSNDLDDELTQAVMLTVGDDLTDEEVDILIADIFDRHNTALRRDIKQLLTRARRSP